MLLFHNSQYSVAASYIAPAFLGPIILNDLVFYLFNIIFNNVLNARIYQIEGRFVVPRWLHTVFELHFLLKVVVSVHRPENVTQTHRRSNASARVQSGRPSVSITGFLLDLKVTAGHRRGHPAV